MCDNRNESNELIIELQDEDIPAVDVTEDQDDGKIHMTFDELDDMINLIETAPEIEKCKRCPTLNEIRKYLKPNLRERFATALWITETYEFSTDPQIKREEQVSIGYLKRLIQETLVLT